jgi:hypothetical protein
LIKPQTLKPYPHLQLAMSAAKTGKGRIDESLSLGIEWLISGISMAAKQAHQVRKRGTDASKDFV